MKTGKFSESRLNRNDKRHNVKSIILVVIYHPLMKSFSAIIDKNISILYIDKDGEKGIYSTTYGFIS